MVFSAILLKILTPLATLAVITVLRIVDVVLERSRRTKRIFEKQFIKNQPTNF